MTAEQVINALKRAPRHAEVKIATSSNGINMDGWIGIECIAAAVNDMVGPIIEPKGRVIENTQELRCIYSFMDK